MGNGWAPKNNKEEAQRAEREWSSEPDMSGPPLHRGHEAPGDLLPLGAAVDRAPVLVPDVIFLR
jgi:hypothetical protein